MMVQVPLKPFSVEPKQYILLRGLTWEKFKSLQTDFEGIPNVRLSYCEGILEIMGIGKPHELFSYQLGLLLGIYFTEKAIVYFPSGAFSQVVEGITEYQADQSFCFETDKPVPDLCIEIVVSSGSPTKLQKYQLMGVPEVWFWEDGVFELYCLRQSGYEKVSRSECLPDLDLELLNRCLMMASPVEANTMFRAALQV
ncbi:Uma2 family endonuclease [Kovacikia minuta CCNUW1]|uniref:Uma2 family endonuclease n=1 Tax=Kovacikia minuta TaxID=2931930 RepID=UPI001CCCB662|nr:Uma2 family endonuclease [Kovacikia minuta]UBF23695.1 Uma2 family endonuclease [Kovacikia minuta CCNUW1]